MQTISLDVFITALEEAATAFDVRSDVEFDIDGIEGVTHLSLEAIQADQLPDLPREQPVFLICEHGYLSELAGLYFEAAGFTKVSNVAGGMQAWRKRFST